MGKAVFRVYCDAASFNNGYKNPELPQAAGIGIILSFNEKIMQEYSNIFDGENISFGELKAALTGIDLMYKRILRFKAQISKPYNIEIYSDSQFVVKGASVWMKGWIKNKWRNNAGNEVAYKEMWQQLLNEYINNEDLNITFIHVKGHTKSKDFHSQMNDRCDKMAKAEVKIWKENI